MHTESILIKIFDRGDYVLTPHGVGTVIAVDNPKEYMCKARSIQIMVQHKFGNGDNPSNSPLIMSYDVPVLITKEEYDNHNV